MRAGVFCLFYYTFFTAFFSTNVPVWSGQGDQCDSSHYQKHIHRRVLEVCYRNNPPLCAKRNKKCVEIRKNNITVSIIKVCSKININIMTWIRFIILTQWDKIRFSYLFQALYLGYFSISEPI